jgi:hypothetical protein
MQNGMVIDSITYTSIKGKPDPRKISKLLELYVEIFSDADPEFFKQRVSEHSKLYTILAFHGEQLIGFKIGYPYKETIFYS